jgi:hypothetical protein
MDRSAVNREVPLTPVIPMAGDKTPRTSWLFDGPPHAIDKSIPKPIG